VETVTLQCQPAEGLSADLRWQTSTQWQGYVLQRRLDSSTEWEQAGSWTPSQIQEAPGLYHLVDTVPEAGIWHYQLLGQGPSGSPTVIGHADITLDPTPLAFRLHPALPNPFGPSTWIQCDLPHAGLCDLRITDLAGRTVRRLFGGTAKSGALRVPWDGTDDSGRAVGSGIYFVSAQAPGQGKQVEKVVVMR